MGKKLLVVCGPTATGKTTLAIHLSKVFDGEIVSADSRQIYKGMDIGTGKDLPVNSKLQITNYKLRKINIGYYEIGGVRVWGYDLVEPAEEFSVAQYLKIAEKIIENISRRQKFPILVGGAGLYIKGVVDGILTAHVPRNDRLRRTLNNKSVAELFEMLKKMDSVKANKMNFSDKKNPRRLIRAIEINQFKIKKPTIVMNDNLRLRINRVKRDVLFVGLKAPREVLEKRIEERVDRRVELGFERESESLIKKGVSLDSQSLQSLGYRQWGKYFQGEISRSDAIELWKQEEKKYAKRQMVWFKKDHRIRWFDISQKPFAKDIENLVRGWYSND